MVLPHKTPTTSKRRTRRTSMETTTETTTEAPTETTTLDSTLDDTLEYSTTEDTTTTTTKSPKKSTTKPPPKSTPKSPKSTPPHAKNSPKTPSSTPRASSKDSGLMPPPSGPLMKRETKGLISPTPSKQLLIVQKSTATTIPTSELPPLAQASPKSKSPAISPQQELLSGISPKGTTRSGRTSVAPLAYWENKVYFTPFHAAYSVIRHATESHRTPSESTPRTTKDKKHEREELPSGEKSAKEKPKAAKRPKRGSGSEDEHNEDEKKDVEVEEEETEEKEDEVVEVDPPKEAKKKARAPKNTKKAVKAKKAATKTDKEATRKSSRLKGEKAKVPEPEESEEENEVGGWEGVGRDSDNERADDEEEQKDVGPRKKRRLAAEQEKEKEKDEGRRPLHSRATAAKITKKAKERTTPTKSPKKRSQPESTTTEPTRRSTRSSKTQLVAESQDKRAAKETVEKAKKRPTKKQKEDKDNSDAESEEKPSKTKSGKAKETTTKSKPKPQDKKGDKKTKRGEDKPTREQDQDEEEEEVDEEGWTQEEMATLLKAYNKHQKAGPLVWELVAKALPGKTMQQCCDKYQAAYPTPNPKPKGKKAKEVADDIDVENLGGVGTLKRKRKLRNLNEMANQGHVHDAFNSTPLKRIQKVFSVDTSGDEEDNVDELFSSQVELPEPSSQSSPTTKGETLLKGFNFDVLDKYSKKLMNLGPGAKGNRKIPTPKRIATHETSRKEQMHNLQQDAAKVASLSRDPNSSIGSLDESEDFYFSSDAEV